MWKSEMFGGFQVWTYLRYRYIRYHGETPISLGQCSNDSNTRTQPLELKLQTIQAPLWIKLNLTTHPSCGYHISWYPLVMTNSLRTWTLPSWNDVNFRSYNMVIFFTHTSSTAQGGGGSFKDRKPIGEVRCCESWMAEQSHWWIERWLSVGLFIYLSICLSH